MDAVRKADAIELAFKPDVTVIELAFKTDVAVIELVCTCDVENVLAFKIRSETI